KTGGHWRLEADGWKLFSPLRALRALRALRLCGSISWPLAAGRWPLAAGRWPLAAFPCDWFLPRGGCCKSLLTLLGVNIR
ncbi:hypothetical protein, partial [Marichromatium sp. AB32]|uniref:hypothetical protein n=1 Tax=Marichromatium sp. AB32 TaxID=2483363 RepID=UPI000F3CD270